MTKQFQFAGFVNDFAVPFDVTLRAAGAFDANGKWQDGAPTTESRTGIFLPLSEDDMQFVGNGTFTEKDRKLYVLQSLPMGAELVKGGQKYRVESSKDYSDYADVYIYFVKGAGQ